MKLSIYSLSIALLMLASCNKDIKLDVNGGTPDGFDVKPNASNTYKVGQDVVFDLSGKADIVSFYSGELYREYAFKTGRILDMTAPTVTFTSAVTGGTQTNQLTVLASTDFNGIYNDTLKAPLTDIHAATWTDITSRFALGTSATFLTSGAKNIADLAVAGKPLYLAFKYTTKPQTVNGAARTWMIQGFTLTGTASVGTLTLADMTNAGFRIVDGSPTTAPTQSAIIPTRFTLLGNTFTPTNDPLTETWAVSRAFNVGKIDAGPDYPVGLKGTANPTMITYVYKYAKAGTYKVTFVAKNANSQEAKEVIRQFDITIVP